MSTVLKLLIKYLGLPLIEKLGKWVMSEFNAWQSRRKIIKDQLKKTRRIDEAKTIDEVKSAHRSNRL